MKIKLFTISNLLTLSNLLCGMIATVAILTDGDLHLAFWLLVLATLLLLLWPRRVTLDGLNSPHAILLRADSGSRVASTSSQNSRRKVLRRCFRRCGEVFILVLILFCKIKSAFIP